MHKHSIDGSPGPSSDRATTLPGLEVRCRARWPRTCPTGPSRPDCHNDADTPQGHERQESGTHDDVDYLQHEQP